MLTPADLYTQGIRNKFRDYYATWLPNKLLNVGDVGELKGDTFQKLTHLDELKIPYKIEDEGHFESIDCTSGKDVTFSLEQKGSGGDIDSAISGSGKIKLEFSNKGAFILQAYDGYSKTISNIADLGKQIIQLNEIKVWSNSWIVITNVVHFKKASIIISNSKASEIEFGLSSEVVKENSGNYNIGGNLKILGQKGEMFKLIGDSKITPLFQAYRVRRRLLSQSKLVLSSARSISQSSSNIPQYEYTFEKLDNNM